MYVYMYEIQLSARRGQSVSLPLNPQSLCMSVDSLQFKLVLFNLCFFLVWTPGPWSCFPPM